MTKLHTYAILKYFISYCKRIPIWIYVYVCTLYHMCVCVDLSVCGHCVWTIVWDVCQEWHLKLFADKKLLRPLRCLCTPYFSLENQWVSDAWFPVVSTWMPTVVSPWERGYESTANSCQRGVSQGLAGSAKEISWVCEFVYGLWWRISSTISVRNYVLALHHRCGLLSSL